MFGGIIDLTDRKFITKYFENYELTSVSDTLISLKKTRKDNIECVARVSVYGFRSTEVKYGSLNRFSFAVDSLFIVCDIFQTLKEIKASMLTLQ